MNKNFSPIVLFVFNRFEKTIKTIDSILLNQESIHSELYVFSDGPKTECDFNVINKIREYIKNLKGFKKIHLHEREKNLGLANSIISGVNEVFYQHKNLIVLEDDIIVSKNFLYFMNKALNEFYLNKTIFSISGYSYSNKINTKDTYAFSRFSSWGWATWTDRWSKIDFNYSKDDIPILKKNKKKINLAGEDLLEMYIDQIEGKIDSWAVRFAIGQCLNQGLTIYPKYSLVNNIGFDKEATHTKNFDPIFLSEFSNDFRPKSLTLSENQKLNFYIRKKFKKNFYNRVKVSLKKLISFLSQKK